MTVTSAPPALEPADVPSRPGPEAHRRAPALRKPRLTGRVRAEESNLGAGFLGIAATTLAVLLLVFDLGRFAVEWRSLARPELASAAWLLLAALVLTLATVARRGGDQLPRWFSATISLGLAGVVALDAAAVWGGGDLGRDLTAAPATGLVLLAMAALRPTRSIMVAAAVLGAALVVLTALARTGATPDSAVETSVGMVARAVAPPLIAGVILHLFRRIVGVELERVLVSSTVASPRMSVGMLASEELARLDLAAEQLLDDVATGHARLPLNPSGAQAAAELATELRLHLIEGRRQTWLFHAVSESELLGRTVALSDPDSLAGLLDARQRDGLLQAVWLLVGDGVDRSRRGAVRRSVDIRFEPVAAGDDVPGAREKRITILMSTTGVPRKRVDPGAWDAVRKVGRHTDSQRSGSLSLEIDCTVERS